MKFRRLPFIAGFLFVPVVLYVIYVVSPFVQTVFYSFTDWGGFSNTQNFIGVGNYVRLLQDDIFLKAVLHNAFLLVLMPVVTILLALFLAFMLNVGGRGDSAGIRGVRGSSVYKVVLFFPQVLSVAIIVVLFQSVFRTDGRGLLNGLLIALGLVDPNKPVQWFNSPDLVLWCLLGVMVWSGVGFYMVLFSAAMQSIPKEIYEAALLDGASRGPTFFRITLPLLWENISVAWVYLGFIALDGFALVTGLTPDSGGGGPDHASELISNVLYRTAFTQGKFGLACAMGVALAVFSLLLAIVQLRITRRDRIEF
ncbi:carbohydrate ABC transporter permease [Kutzneria sp. 744]|uniref:carbohydrate ABC transporter permease n=1 Tax=Kutzneria sp. (strain 744) TaxID=345341 RepID=UPI0004B7F5B3|nr:sugar ABC transporter permease [Kutzneria sp. 744]